MKVAILSVDYLPLMYCDIQKAITLIYLGKAEIVKATERVFRSVSSEIKVPEIIRLVKKVSRKFRPRVVFTRQNVFIRDRYTCQYCGSPEDLTIDHVMPRSRQGTNTWDNVVAACKPCNAAKGDKTPDEAGMPLKRQPKKPATLMHIDWDEIFGKM